MAVAAWGQGNYYEALRACRAMTTEYAMAILEAIQVWKEYGGSGAVQVPALRGVDAVVEPGEFLAIMGPSGCGKSTLLHVMGGIVQPTSGLASSFKK